MNRIASAGELSASIAHEVSQPLTGISTRASAALRWLRAERPDLQKVGISLEHILAASHRASDIIASVRAMFKTNETARSAVDVNSLIRAVLALLRTDLEKNEVRVQTELDADLSAASGDKVQLQQVILNLIMNGIEAMQTVQLRVLKVSTSHSRENTVHVSIEDSGTGLDTLNLERIFEPLFTTKSHGMGMGLAICRSIIEDHDGRIWVTPGTCKWLALPIRITDYARTILHGAVDRGCELCRAHISSLDGAPSRRSPCSSPAPRAADRPCPCDEFLGVVACKWRHDTPWCPNCCRKAPVSQSMLDIHLSISINLMKWK